MDPIHNRQARTAAKGHISMGSRIHHSRPWVFRRDDDLGGCAMRYTRLTRVSILYETPCCIP